MKYTYKHMNDLDGVEFPDFTKYNGNLILYGAGINGALCAFALKELGVDFLCYCDSDPSKNGSTYMGHSVLSPRECQCKYPEAAVLFDVYGSGTDLEKLSSLGYETVLYPASLFIGLDCDRAAKFITEWLGHGDDGYSFREQVDALQVFEWIDEYMIRGIKYVTGRREMSRCVNLDITDRCTLRCKNCLALKSYFKTREDMLWEDMEQTIDRLLAIKWFRRFHIMGGEPFLYPHLDKILQKLCAVDDIEHISILTNGTVVPNESVFKALQNEKVMVRISYYGELSSHYKDLEQGCKERGIEVRVHAQRWMDIGRALDTISDEHETQVRFTECSQREGSFFYVLHGKATLCPFAANTRELGLYPMDHKDYVDINESKSPEDLFEQLDSLYWEKTPLTACRYCNGWLHYATKPIPVAQQCEVGEQPEFPVYK